MRTWSLRPLLSRFRMAVLSLLGHCVCAFILFGCVSIYSICAHIKRSCCCTASTSCSYSASSRYRFYYFVYRTVLNQHDDERIFRTQSILATNVLLTAYGRDCVKPRLLNVMQRTAGVSNTTLMVVCCFVQCRAELGL